MSHAASLQLQAAIDLLKRYATVFRHAWAERKALDGPQRLPHEAAFLPAALELTETPVSPAPRIAMGLIMTFALIALLWSVFGRLDLVATAHGKIVPGGRTKVIQPMETATVKAIHVSDGQTVQAGEVLVELDTTANFVGKNFQKPARSGNHGSKWRQALRAMTVVIDNAFAICG